MSSMRPVDMLHHALVAGLYVVLFVPLLFAPWFVFPFITLKVFVFQALVGVLAALWLMLILFGRLSPPTLTPALASFLVLLAALMVSALHGVDPARSLWSTQERALGLVAFSHFVLLFVMLQTLGRELNWDRYLIVSITVSALAALFAFVHIAHPHLFLETTASNDRPGSFLGNPTFLAAYLLPHIFLALWLAAERLSSRSWGAGFALTALALVEALALLMTQSRGALLAVVVGAFALCVCAVFRDRGTGIAGFTVRYSAIGILGFLSLSGGALWLAPQASIWQRVPGVRRLAALTLASPDIQPRLITLRIAWDAFKERPLLGCGFENFKYPFDARYDPTLLRYGFDATYFDKPHNTLVEYAVTGGIMVMLAYVAVFAALVRTLFASETLRLFAPFGTAILVSHFVFGLGVFDTFGGCLPMVVVAAMIDTEASAPSLDRKRRGRVSGVARRTGVSIAMLAGAAALLWAVMNVSAVYANNREYWMLRYFAGRDSERAMAAHARAVTAAFNPYRDEMQRDYAVALGRLYVQGVGIPNVNREIRRAMSAYRGLIERNPNDYFARLGFADLATVFYRVDPDYLRQGVEEIANAVRLSPKRQQIRFAEAKIRMLQGRSEDALSVLREAVELDPQVGDSHFYYGVIALAVGKQEEGLEAIATAHRLGRDPKNDAEARVIADKYSDPANGH